MSLLPSAQQLIDLAEQGKLPGSMIRFAIRQLCKRRLANETARDPQSQQQRFQALIRQLRESPIALETDAANEQHYEVPTAFYLNSLGARLKYSCAYYPNHNTTLDQAELAMLELYGERAQLEDGQHILELGCGWGSLTLWMAEQYPNAQITAVSNSSTQKTHIDEICETRGFDHVDVVTTDVNHLKLNTNQFDRAISIEMFEHMRNYQHLLEQISCWLKFDGLLFVHIFAHRYLMYPFEVKSDTDWMSKYFFTGGLMPAVDTLLHFQDHLSLQERWLVNGKHYQKTCNHWLEKLDHNKQVIAPHFAQCYGQDQAAVWIQRWRMFYMSCAELFGMNKGNEWLVAHYLFENRSS